MNWQKVLEDTGLRNLPYKVELSSNGQVILTQRKILQSFLSAQISVLLNKQKMHGVCFTSCAISTRKGTRVADVAWASDKVVLKIFDQLEAVVVPEICVEVLSKSNSDFKISEKRKLYFERGANEVWTCDEHGTMRFFGSNGKIEKSLMFSDFPMKVEIPER